MHRKQRKRQPIGIRANPRCPFSIDLSHGTMRQRAPDGNRVAERPSMSTAVRIAKETLRLGQLQTRARSRQPQLPPEIHTRTLRRTRVPKKTARRQPVGLLTFVTTSVDQRFQNVNLRSNIADRITERGGRGPRNVLRLLVLNRQSGPSCGLSGLSL